MNKTAIKNFAVWARKKLISDTMYKAALIGITEEGISEPVSGEGGVYVFDIGGAAKYSLSGKQTKQWDKLAETIAEKSKSMKYADAYKQIIEETAYTWFNRLIAVRFMEVNGYLPDKLRVLEPRKGHAEPDLMERPFESRIKFSAEEEEVILNYKRSAQTDELFRFLFIKECNELSEVLPRLFEKKDDHTELLMNISFSSEDGAVKRLINDIDASDFKDAVEIIGWLYQYYNEEERDRVINIYKGAIEKADIPAATQIFTTDWIVKYMVDNSLGKYWLERNPDSRLKEKLEYYIPSGYDEMENNLKLDTVKPEELTFFDPCVGSGHILSYAFDVLMEIYRECGYQDPDAAKNIVKNNLFGLDIDTRAAQLAYFAVMMKARKYNRRWLKKSSEPNIYAIEESDGMSEYDDALADDTVTANYLISVFKDAKETGSLIKPAAKDYKAFIHNLKPAKSYNDSYFQPSFINTNLQNDSDKLEKLAVLAEMMSRKYKIVCTNPPYMNRLGGRLRETARKYYKDYSGDLFSLFMYRNFEYCDDDGYCAFMTPFVWMFIKSYERLRRFIISHKCITSLVQLEYSAFEEATVPICTFVIRNARSPQGLDSADGLNRSKGVFIKLTDFKGGMQVQKKFFLDGIKDPDCGYRYEREMSVFEKLPGAPIAYWAGERLISAYSLGVRLDSIAEPKQGMATADNRRFTRLWHEVDVGAIKFGAKNREEAAESGCKWFPYNKGGDFRKWYGNENYIVDWENDGEEIRNFRDGRGKLRSRPQNMDFFFKPSITWSKISSGNISFRFKPEGHIFDVAGTSIFADEDTLYYLAGFCNSSTALEYAKLLSPTLNYEVGHISKFPVIISEACKPRIIELVKRNIEICKADWDSFETSSEFKIHPLAAESASTVEEAYQNRKAKTDDMFGELKRNEEELNKIFTDIYGLDDEVSYKVENKYISVKRVSAADDVKSLISYAVGCMFGRYSLDRSGLICAGRRFDIGEYSRFKPAEDNLLLILDGDEANALKKANPDILKYDITERFVEFIGEVFGAEKLEENLIYIANALDENHSKIEGVSAVDAVRDYFIKNFYKDHIKTYKKRPIYWQIESGSRRGFTALVYAHRLNSRTFSAARSKYLPALINCCEGEIEEVKRLTSINSIKARSAEGSKLNAKKLKFTNKLNECITCTNKLDKLDLSNINIDLDDGIEFNHHKCQCDADGKSVNLFTPISYK